MKHKLSIEKNAEGSKLAIMEPINEDGTIDRGYRISGPKAWGGSVELASIFIADADLITYLNEYAPHIKEQLN